MSHERSDHGDERAGPGDGGGRDDGDDGDEQASDDELPAPPHTVHDAFFKKMFSDPENALGELRAVLPARVAAHLDLDTLELQHASVVEDWLRQRHGDLVYTARTKEAAPVLLWFLLEHQSSVEPFMAWEILQKAVAMMKDWRSKHPDATRLPAVLSFVLYNGDGPWTAPTSIQELIELSEPARAPGQGQAGDGAILPVEHQRRTHARAAHRAARAGRGPGDRRSHADRRTTDRTTRIRQGPRQGPR